VSDFGTLRCLVGRFQVSPQDALQQQPWLLLQGQAVSGSNAELPDGTSLVTLGGELAPICAPAQRQAISAGLPLCEPYSS
jgi:hypothetical protein